MEIALTASLHMPLTPSDVTRVDMAAALLGQVMGLDSGNLEPWRSGMANETGGRTGRMWEIH